MRLGGVNSVDGLPRPDNLLGQDSAGVTVSLLGRLFHGSLDLLLLPLNTSDLSVQLVDLFPDLRSPFVHLKLGQA